MKVTAAPMVVLASIASIAAASAAMAQNLGPDPNAPLELGADSQTVQNGSCTSVLTGHVQITQGHARVVGQTVKVYLTKKGNACGQVDRIDVDKDVFYVTPDGTVRADHANYDVQNNKVVFTGSVILVRGKDDVATGSKLTVDLKTNDSVMEGPVRALIVPQQKPATPAPAKPAA